MKIAIQQETLISLLKTMILCTDQSPNGKPIFSNIKIEAYKDRALFYAYNMQGSMIKTVEATSDLPGMCTFPAKKVFELVKNLTKGKNVNLTLQEDGRLRVSQGKARYLINSMDPKDFPKVTYFKSDEYTPIDPAVIMEAIDATFYTINKDDIRAALQGIFFEPSDKDGFFRAVATDGHRLSCINLPGVIKESFIVSMETCKILMKILPDAEELGIKYDDNQVFFCLEDGIFNGHLIAREFVQYRKIFPTSKPALVNITRSDMIEKCNRLKGFSGSGNKLELQINTSGILIKAKDENTEAFEEVKLEEGSEVQAEMVLGLNAEFILQALQKLKGDNITMRIHGVRSPIVISEKNLTKIIMPLTV